MSTPRRGRSVALVAALAVVLATVLTELGTYSRNTLRNHAAWAPGKVLTCSYLMGGDEAYATRPLLHQNRLNLGEWHGFYEVLLNRVTSLRSLRFRFSLDRDAYLYAEFNRTASSSFGVRLSRNDARPAAWVECDAAGGFRQVQPFAGLELDGGWHEAEVALRQVAGVDRVVLSVDGWQVAETEVPVAELQVVGFRAGMHPARVDDVVVHDRSGVCVIDEDFRNDHHWWRGWSVALLLVASLLAGVRLLARRRGASPRRSLFATTLVGLAGILFAGSLLALDYGYWSSRYVAGGAESWGRAGLEDSWLEFLRQSASAGFGFTDTADPGAGGAQQARMTRYAGLVEFLELPPRAFLREAMVVGTTGPEGPTMTMVTAEAEPLLAWAQEHRVEQGIAIAYLGSSQTHGAGAVHEVDKLVPVTHAFLSRLLPRDQRLASMNCARSGSRAREQLELHRELTARVEPELVVVNLSNNDEPEGFSEALRDIVAFDREIGAATVFVVEPNTSEGGTAWIERKHAILREVAAAEGVPCIDLHAHLAAREVADDGILWWDRVHLTSHGQRVAAEFLAAELARLLPSSQR